MSIAKAAGNGDAEAFADMTPLIAQLLSKNKKSIRISASIVEESLDTDGMILLLTKLIQWINQERNDPN